MLLVNTGFFMHGTLNNRSWLASRCCPFCNKFIWRYIRGSRAERIQRI